VQFTWWKFLVAREPPSRRGGGGGGGPPPRAQEFVLLGRADVAVRTFAGDQQPGNMDGPGHAARFDRPTGLAIDARSNLYVADAGNHRIRMVSAEGDVTTLAGSAAGYADGPALQARFSAPCGVCLGPDGTVYVADTGNGRIRRIKDGQVTTVGAAPAQAAQTLHRIQTYLQELHYVAGANPGLIVADASSARLRRFSVDGVPQRDQAMPGPPISVLGDPLTVTVPTAGILILGPKTLKNLGFEATDDVTADQANHMFVKQPLAICPFQKGWLLTDSEYRAVIRVLNDKAQVVAGFCSTAGPGRGYRDGDGRTSLFGTVCGIVSDGKRYAFVADTGNNCIRRLDVSELPQ